VKHLRALLINPYIYDVSAFSFWSAPLGLLYLGSVLRENGIDIQLLDCLSVDEARRKEDGRAPFVHARVPTPVAVAAVKKRFKRYGASPATVQSTLENLEPPDLILITSGMTYWYLSTVETVAVARKTLPKARIVVGGLYPSLCYEHAKKHVGADLIVRGGQAFTLYDYIEEVLSKPLSFRPDMETPDALPYPCFDLYGNPPFVPLLTSIGCAYHCVYCATQYLHPKMLRRQPLDVLDEILHWYRYGCHRFVLYDDSFLFKKDAFAKPLLRAVAGLPFNVSFYNPNALNASMVDAETAMLLRAAGFLEVRLGLETADEDFQRQTGGKIDRAGFERAIGFLVRAGFERGSICVYVMSGLPFQRSSDTRKTLEYVAALGLRVSLAQYSPIPHTRLFDVYQNSARYPIAEEPLFQNNALFPFAWEGFTEEEIDELKRYAREKNALLDAVSRTK
jgi:radical SAM superfamily enzyme YgiQ (UPF0313 family)